MPPHRATKLLPSVLAFALLAAGSAASTTLEPVRYVLRFPAPHTHYVEVEASYPTEAAASVELMMPVWTPGSYLLREYSRHVEGLTAADGTTGRPLPAAKTTKNRWRVETNGASRITVRYRVYGREMSVRTNWIEDDFAILNGAPTFITLVGGYARPHEVRLELPASWQRTVTALTPLDATPHAYRAESYDVLVDSPILAGSPDVREFTVANVPHVLAIEGSAGAWDPERTAADLERLVDAHRRFWGALPYPRYVFMNLLTEASGGLEHAASSVMMTGRWKPSTREGYLDWLGTASHELFHAWNGKRLRPEALGPFDYEREAYTPSLWVVEGVTDYYGDLLVRRAGLSTPDDSLRVLSNAIADLESTPGRLVQPLSQASHDAWIKFYRPDENTKNTAVSYYTKGAVVAWLLDAHIRTMSGGTRSLDDAMRAAFAKYSGAKGYTPEEWERTLSATAGVDLRPWLERTVDQAGELDYGPALEWFGLRFRQSDGQRRPLLGIVTRRDDGRLIVAEVRRGTPAYDAGVNVGDEILGIGEYRVLPNEWESRVRMLVPGAPASLLVSRRGELRRIEVTVGTQPGTSWQLERRPDATPAQRARFDAWLSANPSGTDEQQATGSRQ